MLARQWNRPYPVSPNWFVAWNDITVYAHSRKHKNISIPAGPWSRCHMLSRYRYHCYTSSKQSQCSLSGFNLTIWEQRPLWKTEFMAVFCFTGVKSFSVPKKTKNNLKSKSVKGSFCVQRCGSLKSRETSKLIYLPVEHTSNAEENIELSRCGSLADNLSHTNTKLSSAVRNLKNISWDNFHL